MKPLGIYVHVPFCQQKCLYCDFYSMAPGVEEVDAYIQAVREEIASYTERGWQADTVYFGGGTPSRLPAEVLALMMKWIHQTFDISRDAECTLEANPDSLNLPALKLLKKSGFNRISLGMQSSIDQELQALGRSHRNSQLELAVRMAKEAGFDNISVDMMLGIPHQTLKSLRKTLSFVKGLDIQHVSAYLLKIEEGTPFHRQKIQRYCPDEDRMADLYLYAVEWLEKEGFHQYEISNFARPGGESRHNLKYWQMDEYVGIGPSAHSFVDGKRFAHNRDLQEYCRGNSKYYTDEEAGTFEEYGMLRLRLAEGLDLEKAERIFSLDAGKILKKARPLEKAGLLTVNENTIILTAKGFLLSNSIIASLIL